LLKNVCSKFKSDDVILTSIFAPPRKIVEFEEKIWQMRKKQKIFAVVTVVFLH